MCIKVMPSFGKCGHKGSTNPNLTYIETDGCPTKDCESPREREEYRKNEQCFECIGVEPFRERRDGPTVFYKHCFQSEICGHEFEHVITDAERDPFEPEVILATPIPNDICPDCMANGYDAQRRGTNPPPKTASITPQDFEGITRRSVLPGTLPFRTYQSGASHPQSGASTKAPDVSTTRASASKAPSSNVAPTSSRHPTTHPSIAPSYTPTTAIHSVPSQPSRTPSGNSMYPAPRSSTPEMPRITITSPSLPPLASNAAHHPPVTQSTRGFTNPTSPKAPTQSSAPRQSSVPASFQSASTSPTRHNKATKLTGERVSTIAEGMNTLWASD